MLARVRRLSLFVCALLLGCTSAQSGTTTLPAAARARALAPAAELRNVASTEPVIFPPEPEPVVAASPALREFGQPVVARSETRAVVLLYHAFNRGGQSLSVKARDFDAQLAWLAENQVEIVSTSELLDFLEGRLALPARVAVISIDDGLISVYSKAWPILKQRRVRFTVGIPTGMLEDPKNAPVMTWEQVREMVSSGLCEVASHGHMHRSLINLSGKRRWEELELSRDLIRQRVGAPPVAYFYPLGAFDTLGARAVRKAGYRAAFRATGAPIAAGAGSSFWLPRVSIFHGDPPDVLAHFYGAKFLSQVRYDERRDAALVAQSQQ